MDNASTTSDTIGTFLVGATMLGGVVMGVLYLAHRWSEK